MTHSPETTPQDIPHAITVTTLDNGDRDYDWTHPDNCPDGEDCDIRRRLHRARSEYLVEMVAGRPDGTYRLGRFGFHGLDLVDERGILLPDLVEAMSPAAKAARDVASLIIRDLAEAVCEDADSLTELCRHIQAGGQTDELEGSGNHAVATVIEEYLGTMRKYAKPIDRLLNA
ncbi:hypothetical protein [Streptomyces sp. NPDC059916]|uniref:hypothetical protein n=1 Tax=Streptomyces sp. NPDC059916 TaxID=3347001 RepID=UPI0036B00360